MFDLFCCSFLFFLPFKFDVQSLHGEKEKAKLPQQYFTIPTQNDWFNAIYSFFSSLMNNNNKNQMLMNANQIHRLDLGRALMLNHVQIRRARLRVPV